ncbi:hypothetical protein [Virgibacillus salexigens]|uniref:hypothetical protein n=1 Tax=Virgibacillus massiliensis TaxID=1462526 RepID=UPI00136C1D3D|nr:hypothetical protein [Virgibacillus massiliensis]MYL43892.1 hypothetical protein [Virgibacillus massiliensis]
MHKNKHIALNSWLVTCESNILVWFSNARDEPYDRLFTKEMTIDEIKKWCKFREYKVIGTFEIKRDSALGITFINPISYQKDGKSFNVRSIYIFKKRKPKI